MFHDIVWCFQLWKASILCRIYKVQAGNGNENPAFQKNRIKVQENRRSFLLMRWATTSQSRFCKLNPVNTFEVSWPFATSFMTCSFNKHHQSQEEALSTYTREFSSPWEYTFPKSNHFFHALLQKKASKPNVKSKSFCYIPSTKILSAGVIKLKWY